VAVIELAGRRYSIPVNRDLWVFAKGSGFEPAPSNKRLKLAARVD
jgi:hypothetical protein